MKSIRVPSSGLRNTKVHAVSSEDTITQGTINDRFYISDLNVSTISVKLVIITERKLIFFKSINYAKKIYIYIYITARIYIITKKRENILYRKIN